MNNTTDNKVNVNQTYEQLKARNDAMADLEHANLANIINRMSDHLETVLKQRDAAVAALRECQTSEWAVAFARPDRPKFALQRLSAINAIVYAAIAATEGSAQ